MKYIYEFKWDVKFILLKNDDREKDITVLPKTIKIVSKACLYDKEFLPRFVIKFTVEDEYLNIFHNYQSDLICNITLIKMVYDGNTNELQNSNKKGSDNDDTLIKEEKVFEYNYVPIFDKPLPKTVIKGEMQIDVKTGKIPERTPDIEASNPSSINLSTIECSLFELDDRRLNKFIVNSHIIEATVGDAVGTIITSVCNKDKAQLKSGVIMDPPDNNTQYKDIWILPYNLYKSIKSIQRIYGIYFYGIEIFLDNGLLYILKKYISNHEYSADQTPYTKIRLFQKPGSIKYPYSVNIDEKNENVAIYDATGTIQPINNDVAMTESVGDKLAFTNMNLINEIIKVQKGKATVQGDGLLVLTKPSKGHKETGTKIMVEYDDINNPFNMYELLKATSTNKTLVLDINGVNPEDFTPNKKIILEIADDEVKNAEYQGDYCINSAIFIFTPKPQMDKTNETSCACKLVISKGL